MLRFLLLVLVLAQFLASCGSSSNQSGNAAAIQGIAVPGSTYAGAVISAKSADDNYPRSSIFFYEFNTGKVTELLTVESRDPSVFMAGGKAILFHRGNSAPTFQVLDPTKPNSAADPIAIEALTKGDPWDAVGIAGPGGETYVFAASPGAGKIVTFPLSNPALAAPIDGEWSLPSGATFRPTGLLQVNNRLYIKHQGLTVTADTPTANGSQKVFALNVDDPSKAEPISIGLRLTGEITGVSTTSSTAQKFSNSKSTAPLLVGLCSEDLGALCRAGVDKFNTGTGQITRTAALADSDFKFFNQVIDGESDSVVYIQATKKSSPEKVLTRLDTTSGVQTAVHTYPDDNRLYGTFQDSSTGTLFVGNYADLSGELVLYKNSIRLGSFALPSVPYAAVLVPR